MAVVKLIQEKEGLEQKVWIDSREHLWNSSMNEGKSTLILNTKDPVWQGEYKIKKMEVVFNYKEGEELPIYIEADMVTGMEVRMYLKKIKKKNEKAIN